MLTWKAWAVWWLLAVASLFYLVGSSPSFQQCVGRDQEHASTQTFEQGVSNLFVVLGDIRECLGVFVETNHTAIDALATLLIAAFTGTLWWSTHRLWKATREEFIATHRPRILVHSFHYSSEGADKIGAMFSYVNTGASAATVEAIAGQIAEVFEIPSRAPSIGPQKLVGKKLAGGEEAMFTISSSLTHKQMVIDGERKRRGHSYLFAVCTGYVAYSDELGIRRKTGFCRRYDPDTRSWLRVENSDYEYAY